MRLRPYISSIDYEHLQKWVDTERTHALWCANRIPYPMNAEELQDFLDKDARDWGGCAYVATKDDGDPIGFFVLAVNTSNNVGFLKFVIVNHELRGQGYGTQVLELMLRYAFEIVGVSSVQLNVFGINENAKKCYSRVGFIQDSVAGHAFSFENENWDRCHMVVTKGGDCMKKVLLGISLILFGFNLTYASVNAGWSPMDVIGLLISVVGIIVSLIGGLGGDK